MAETQTTFFLTEIESPPSSYSSEISFHNIRSINLEAEDKLDLIYLDLHDLLDETNSAQQTTSPCSPTHQVHISNILAELNDLARWTTVPNDCDEPFPPLPLLFCRIQLSDWRSTQPNSVALEYALLLWTVGYLDSSFESPYVKLSLSQNMQRSELVKAFQLNLDSLLAITSYVKSNDSQSSFDSNKQRLRNLSGIALDDIQLELSKESHASKQRKWYFLDKCRPTNTALLSKSLSALPVLNSSPSKVKRHKKKPHHKPRSAVSSDMLRGLEMALQTGDSLGRLCVHFILTTTS